MKKILLVLLLVAVVFNSLVPLTGCIIKIGFCEMKDLHGFSNKFSASLIQHPSSKVFLEIKKYFMYHDVSFLNNALFFSNSYEELHMVAMNFEHVFFRGIDKKIFLEKCKKLIENNYEFKRIMYTVPEDSYEQYYKEIINHKKE